jgi:hypothetical protein
MLNLTVESNLEKRTGNVGRRDIATGNSNGIVQELGFTHRLDF